MCKYSFNPDDNNSGWIHPLKRYFASHMTYLLPPMKLFWVIKKFSPDIVHIEEDPHALISLEIRILLFFIKKKIAVSFFIWDNINRKPSFPLSILKKILTHISLPNAKGVICGNNKGLEILKNEKFYTGVTRLIPQFGINLEKYNLSSSKKIIELTDLNPEDVLIGYVGRLVPEKGIYTLLESLIIIKDIPWKAIFIGNGPLSTEILAFKNNFEENRVFVMDACSHDEVPDVLATLDVFVLPSITTSIWVEQFGLTLAQAMASKVACIGSNSGAIPDVINHAGLIFNESDQEDLARCLKKIILNKSLRNQLEEQGYVNIENNYSENAIAQKHAEFFKSLM